MTTHHPTCLPHALRGGLCVGAWMPASPLRPSSRRPAGNPIRIGKAFGTRFGLVPH
jgi:hypothetical protein